MSIDIGALGWLVVALLHGSSPVQDYGVGKTLCVVSVKTPAHAVTVIQQDTTGRILPFGVWHYGKPLCGHWGFRVRRGRLGYVVANDTSWGAPL